MLLRALGVIRFSCSGLSIGFSLQGCAIFPNRFFMTGINLLFMKQNLSSSERIIRSGLGLVIVAVGIYGVFVNLWLGLFVLGAGVFTVYEGYAGWTLVAALADSWIRPDGGNLEMPGIGKQKQQAPGKN